MNDSESTPQPEEPTSAGTESADRQNVLAILAYVPILCLLPLMQEEREPDLQRHAAQGLVLFLLELILVILLIPGVSRFLLGLALVICGLFALIAAWNAWQGRYWRIPFISDLAERKRAGGDQA